MEVLNKSKDQKLYEKEFSEDGFWKKIKRHTQSAGKATIKATLTMYYAAQDADTPIWAKTTIYGALGYFISPVDAIPDVTPIIGYSDDLGVLIVATATIAAHIKTKHEEHAKEKLKQWLD